MLVEGSEQLHPDLGLSFLSSLGWQHCIVLMIVSWKYGLMISWKSLFFPSNLLSLTHFLNK